MNEEIETATPLRSVLSYVLIALFIIFVSLGTAILSVGAGFIAFGVSCGLVGFLLGLE